MSRPLLCSYEVVCLLILRCILSQLTTQSTHTVDLAVVGSPSGKLALHATLPLQGDCQRWDRPDSHDEQDDGQVVRGVLRHEVCDVLHHAAAVRLPS